MLTQPKSSQCPLSQKDPLNPLIHKDPLYQLGHNDPLKQLSQGNLIKYFARDIFEHDSTILFVYVIISVVKFQNLVIIYCFRLIRFLV
jgi:hypothetical protein